jgi:hypothetical protein
MADDVERRCGTCARFARVVETIDSTGEVRRKGACLLGVWPSPLYDDNTCNQWVQKGEFKARPELPRRERPQAPARGASPSFGSSSHSRDREEPRSTQLALPEDLLDMDAEEFKRVLRYVIRDELGVGEMHISSKWHGGELVLKPGKDGLQEKRIPIDALFHKVVMVRDKLRVLEQKINAHPKLSDEDKVQMQQYVTGCYGSLTTFNVLFSDREDQFIGQKSDE